MRNYYLHSKIASLAAEARIIRNLEKKRKAVARDMERRALEHVDSVEDAFMREDRMKEVWTEYQRLREHRTDKVRKEARFSHLAYGFLRGTPYKAMEEKAYEKPDFPRILAIALRFGVDGHEMAKMTEKIKHKGLSEAAIRYASEVAARFNVETSKVRQRFAQWLDEAGVWICPAPKPKRIRPTRYIVQPGSQATG